ncbi:YihY/virulence factor BrkB family protein [Microbacterium sp. H83]|uniref:YihY/virulence factor BrkB family protein n=1 Tax=Microbacterium sp. H83 TaxID=1827324 RepID=UPI0007F3C22A|nr:YihY/virulence factor BrkB family protein [Microbacterium sp. H83]OAN39191.1 ribonuclease BN [Microbacterium sp. H83]
MPQQATSPSEHDAPHPEDDHKPDTPAQLERRSWKYILVKTVREFTADQCVDAAAGLTYYAVLSLFPALIAIFSLLGLFGQEGAASDAVIGILADVAPADTVEALRGPLEQLSNAPGAGFALVSGILLALWSASGYVGAFSRAMNRIYEIEEGRPFWKLRPMQLLVTIITVVALTVAAVALVLSGDIARSIGDAIGVGESVAVVWSIVRWPLLVFLVIFLVAVLYYATPNAKQPKFRWISLGAVIAIVVLAIATVGFVLYVTNFSNYERTYGSLAGVIVFLLWLWIANLALLFGAEFDAELERGRQLQAGIAAEEDIQLPPRDTRQSDKRAEKEEKDIAEGRRIRQDQDSPDQQRSDS